jgi:hypothetical protein
MRIHRKAGWLPLRETGSERGFALLRGGFRNRSTRIECFGELRFPPVAVGGFTPVQPWASFAGMAITPTTLTNHAMLLILCARIGYSPHTH